MRRFGRFFSEKAPFSTGPGWLADQPRIGIGLNSEVDGLGTEVGL